jgi:hypothetical protein
LSIIMVVLSLQRALLLAGAVLPLAQQGLAQTIKNTEGEVIREYPRVLNWPTHGSSGTNSLADDMQPRMRSPLPQPRVPQPTLRQTLRRVS